MRTNQTKAKLRSGEAVIGCALQQYRAAEIPRLLAASGFDFLFVDTEHGGFDLETVQDMVAAAAHAGITPLVRVPEMLYSQVARALDVGAQGIIFPRVEDPELLQEAIIWMRYPPGGVRGFGVMPAQLDYEPHNLPEIMRHMDAETMIVVQFESEKAIDGCEELLAISGIDVALVGPADLSISLGVPGEFEHPRLVNAVMRLIEACSRRGVVPGIHCRTAAAAKSWLARGMRFVGAGSEQSMLLDKAREAVTVLRAAASQPNASASVEETSRA